jgi:hypothetical protein
MQFQDIHDTVEDRRQTFDAMLLDRLARFYKLSVPGDRFVTPPARAVLALRGGRISVIRTMMITTAALAVFLGLLNLATPYDDTLTLAGALVMLGALALYCRVFPDGQPTDSKVDRSEASRGADRDDVR